VCGACGACGEKEGRRSLKKTKTKKKKYRTTGTRDSQIMMSDICRRILNFFSIVSWQHSSNLSAQSPPCPQNKLNYYILIQKTKKNKIKI
jgi:hypothetical protein